jgi:hypothetical protein
MRSLEFELLESLPRQQLLALPLELEKSGSLWSGELGGFEGSVSDGPSSGGELVCDDRGVAGVPGASEGSSHVAFSEDTPLARLDQSIDPSLGLSRMVSLARGAPWASQELKPCQ